MESGQISTKINIQSVKTKVPLKVSITMIGAAIIGASFIFIMLSSPIENTQKIAIKYPAPTPFTPEEITDATLDHSYNDHASIIFSRADETMGTLNPNNNEFTPGVPVLSSDQPLVVILDNIYPGEIVFPESKMKVDYLPDSQNLVLCVPETAILSNGSFNYYYDDKGTPYYDDQLKEMATAESCDGLMADPFTPEEITDASLNQTFTDLSEITLLRADEIMGSLDPSTNEFTPGVSVLSSDQPLVMVLDSNESGVIVFPERTMRVDYLPESQTKVLCIPETTIQSYGAFNYYYDINGTPYYDDWLTEKAHCNPIPKERDKQAI